jgi:hypothetical protein
LFENLVVFCETKKLDVFKIVPLTFTLQFDSMFVSNELEKFISFFNAAKGCDTADELNPKVGGT